MNKLILAPAYFAANEYSCGAYGAGNYNESGCATTTTPSSGTGSLADTGYDVLIPIFLGISLILASVILIVRKLMRRRKNKQVNR